MPNGNGADRIRTFRLKRLIGQELTIGGAAVRIIGTNGPRVELEFLLPPGVMVEADRDAAAINRVFFFARDLDHWLRAFRRKDAPPKEAPRQAER